MSPREYQPRIPKRLMPTRDVRYFAMSVDADRYVSGIANFKRGVWYQIPRGFFLELERVIAEGKQNNKAISWQVRAE